MLAGCSSEHSGEGTVAGPTSPPTTGGTATGEVRGTLRIRLEAVVSGLDAPVAMASTPSEPNRLYVVEQPGVIRVIENGELVREPFLDIHDEVKSGGEQGLLSMAFHPEYASNGLFYVDYTDLNGDTRVVEYQAHPCPARTPEEQIIFAQREIVRRPDARRAARP